MKRVVIIGAGFGGLSLAKHLRRAPVEVIVIDRNNYHTFQPLLYQVATAGLEAEEIAHAVRGIFQKQENFQFRMGEVTGANWSTKELVLSDGATIGFDYLVLAAGGATNYFGVEGAERYGFALKSLEDAVNLRSHIVMSFEKADQLRLVQQDRAVHIVVVGGGPTGVEMAGALCELFQMVLRKDYPALPDEAFQVTLVEASPHLLNAYHESSQAYALKQLKKRGVQVHLDTRVERVTEEAVFLSTGEVLQAQALVWAAGIQANPLGQLLGLPVTRGGRIEVGSDLRVIGFEDVFAIGDIAGSIDDSGQFTPQLAPVAMQGGKHVAREIQNAMQGKPSTSRPFVYKDSGIMATIGRDAAVAELGGGIRNSGFIAWIMWLVLHLMQLVGFRNRMNVLLNWAWNYFTYDRSARLIMPVQDPDTLLIHHENVLEK